MTTFYIVMAGSCDYDSFPWIAGLYATEQEAKARVELEEVRMLQLKTQLDIYNTKYNAIRASLSYEATIQLLGEEPDAPYADYFRIEAVELGVWTHDVWEEKHRIEMARLEADDAAKET